MDDARRSQDPTEDAAAEVTGDVPRPGGRSWPGGAAAEDLAVATEDPAVDVVAWIDFQCPYSERAVAWLDTLPSVVAQVRYRLFALEQVNRDPAATDWRIWEQPLDYAHDRGRPDRRSLAAFLVTTALERDEPPDMVRRFRRAAFDARFVEGADLSDLDLLQRVAVESGADGARLAAALADGAAMRDARERIASDWRDARWPYEVFGVPTLDLGAGAPVYVRLDRAPDADEGIELCRRLVALRRDVPWLLEVKTAPRSAARTS
jgi:hypothetical protein